MRRAVFILAAAVALVVTGVGATLLVRGPIGQSPSQSIPNGPPAPKRLDTGPSFYPRVIQLQHSGSANGRLLASVSVFSRSGLHDTDMARISESTDGGGSFHPLSEIHDERATGDRGSCCATLFELPQQLGGQPAGTLLFGTSVGLGVQPPDRPVPPGRIPGIRVWKSDDHGATWSYLSSCAEGFPDTPRNKGMYEPEFAVDARGDLDCYYSDETQAPDGSQVIASVTSADGGVTWGSRRLIVATEGTDRDRPGMPNVRKLPNGTWFMSYELCEEHPLLCPVYYRISTDGWNWGKDPTKPGMLASTPDGNYLSHTPTIAWTPGGSPNGRILLIGQLVRDAAGRLLRPQSGSTIFVNTEGGFGHWFEVDAPVRVPITDGADGCNNYSSSLLPSATGTRVLELATQVLPEGCEAFYAVGSLTGTGNASGVTSGAIYRLINVQSADCLDVTHSSTAPGANVQQWTCNGASAQDWRFTANASGDFTLTAAISDLCLDVTNGSTAAGANVQQWTCTGSDAQLWRAVGVGRSYYSFVSKVSGLCLDVAGGSTVAGANVQQWTCNHLAPQIWRLDQIQ